MGEVRLALEPSWSHQGHLRGYAAVRKGVLQAQLPSSDTRPGVFGGSFCWGAALSVSRTRRETW